MDTTVFVGNRKHIIILIKRPKKKIPIKRKKNFKDRKLLDTERK